MTKKKNEKKWRLDPKEVGSGWSGWSSGKPGVFARAEKITSSRVTLKHEPTGISVVGEVPAGSYPKKTMKHLVKQLEADLFVTLERKVARHLKKPGW